MTLRTRAAGEARSGLTLPSLFAGRARRPRFLPPFAPGKARASPPTHRLLHFEATLRKIALAGTGPIHSMLRSWLSSGHGNGRPLHAGSESVPASRTTVGGKFLIQSVVGIGGNGIVYEALDKALRRTVALKIPRSQRATQVRFRREAIAGASITHPNVCTLYALGQDSQGAPFLVMERLTGETLAVRLQRETRLPVDLAVDIVCQVLAGLGQACTQDRPSRREAREHLQQRHDAADREDPRLWLLDGERSAWQSLGTRSCRTRKVGTVIGTPAYMSPEQVSGHRDFDPRVDVFACGVVLYEMLTGLRPFRATDTKMLFKQIARGIFVPASIKVPELPRYLDEVLSVALAVERRKRFPTVKAFARRRSRASVIVAHASVRRPSDHESPQAERLAYLRERFRELAVLHKAAKPHGRSPQRLDLPVMVDLDPSSDGFGASDGTTTEKILPNKGRPC